MYLLYFKTEILMSRSLTTLLSFEQLGPNCFPAHHASSEKGDYSRGSNYFSLEFILFQKEAKPILTVLSPLNGYQFPLILYKLCRAKKTTTHKRFLWHDLLFNVIVLWTEE